MRKTALPDATSEHDLTRLLLGDLPELERSRLEDRVLEDDGLFETLCALEDELYDHSVRGDLPRRHRQGFGRLLATPDGRRRLAFAWDLAAVADEQPPVPAPRASWLAALLRPGGHPALRFALAAALVVLTLGAGVLTAQLLGAQRQLARAERLAANRQELLETARARGSELARRVERADAEQDRIAGELERLRSVNQELSTELDAAAEAPPSTVSFVLSLAAVVRGVEEPNYREVPPGADRVELQVDLAGASGYRSYRAALRTLTGGEVWSQDGLAERPTDWGSAVYLTLPADVLSAGDYELILLGLQGGEFEEIGFLNFSIRR